MTTDRKLAEQDERDRKFLRSSNRRVKGLAKLLEKPAKRVEEQFYNQHQSWWYEATYAVGARRLRVTIRRNAYDEQSGVTVDGFSASDLKWNLVASSPIDLLACKRTSYGDKYSVELLDLYRRDADRAIDKIVTTLLS